MRVEDEIFEFFENLVAEIDICTCVFYAFPFSVSFSFLPLFVLCVQKRKKKDTISLVLFHRVKYTVEFCRSLKFDVCFECIFFFFFSFRVYIKF